VKVVTMGLIEEGTNDTQKIFVKYLFHTSSRCHRLSREQNNKPPPSSRVYTQESLKDISD
jgi:hypothetical protein